jgi:hypothetical protein
MDMWVGGGMAWAGGGVALRSESTVTTVTVTGWCPQCAMPTGTGSSRPLSMASMPLSNQSRWEDDVTSSVTVLGRVTWVFDPA